MRRLWLAALTAALPACSQLATTAPTVSPGEEVERSLEDGGHQALYRVRYSGPDGQGTLRLVMRRVTPERFQLRAADTFGRAVWALDYDGDQVLLLDHRRKEACVAGRELRVPELALSSLPLPAVARVLGGETPLPTPEGADPADWVDDSGRRWTARWQDGVLAAWTLWQSDEPRLWWSRQEDGGILSHRDGAQFRWRRTAREPLSSSAYRRLEVPETYPFGACRTRGEPAGGGAPPPAPGA